MYQTFTVRGFRGFRDLEINDLARINLIGGKNNVARLSLLEAFFLFANPHKGEIWTRSKCLSRTVTDSNKYRYPKKHSF
jgi:AAA15 family ATPase/GTPase